MSTRERDPSSVTSAMKVASVPMFGVQTEDQKIHYHTPPVYTINSTNAICTVTYELQCARGIDPAPRKASSPSVHSHPACTLRVVRESCESRARVVRVTRLRPASGDSAEIWPPSPETQQESTIPTFCALLAFPLLPLTQPAGLNPQSISTFHACPQAPGSNALLPAQRREGDETRASRPSCLCLYICLASSSAAPRCCRTPQRPAPCHDV